MPMLAMEKDVNSSQSDRKICTELKSCENDDNFWENFKDDKNKYINFYKEYNNKLHKSFMKDFSENLFEDYLLIYLQEVLNNNQDANDFLYPDFIPTDENQRHLLIPKSDNKSVLKKTTNEFRINIFTGIILMLVNSSNDFSAFASQYFLKHFLSETSDDTFKYEIGQYKTLLQSQLTYEVLEYETNKSEDILPNLRNTLDIFDKMLMFVGGSDTITVTPQDPFFLSVLNIFKKLLVLKQWDIVKAKEEIKLFNVNNKEYYFTHAIMKEEINKDKFIYVLDQSGQSNFVGLITTLNLALKTLLFKRKKGPCSEESFICSFLISINGFYKTKEEKKTQEISLINRILIVYYFLVKNKEYYNSLYRESSLEEQHKKEDRESNFIILGNNLLRAIFITKKNKELINKIELKEKENNTKETSEKVIESADRVNIIKNKMLTSISDFEEYLFNLEDNFIDICTRNSYVYVKRLTFARNTQKSIRNFISSHSTINSIFAETFFQYRPLGTNFIHILTKDSKISQKIQEKAAEINKNNKLILNNSFFIRDENMLCYKHPSFTFQPIILEKTNNQLVNRTKQMSIFDKFFSCFSENTEKEVHSKRKNKKNINVISRAFETNTTDLLCIKSSSCPNHIESTNSKNSCEDCELYVSADLNVLFLGSLEMYNDNEDSKNNRDVIERDNKNVVKDYNKSIADYSFLYYHNMLKAPKGQSLDNYHALHMHLLMPAAKDFFTLSDAFQYMIPKIPETEKDKVITRKEYQQLLIENIKNNPFLYNKESRISDENIKKIVKEHGNLYDKINKVYENKKTSKEDIPCDKKSYIYENVCYLFMTFLKTELQDLLIV